ncbi:carbohydrate sulfotransferase [Elysia marginata]|uniref:Carbohydrate sulfotransferase n=1 Tax=Elysia marginata TaxID=1093978 RepID=A0AAV4JU32_9GAST|nr:carbohydrate sulfotransferase [Elysia marginata]
MTSQLWRFFQSRRGITAVLLVIGMFLVPLFLIGKNTSRIARFKISQVFGSKPARTVTADSSHRQVGTPSEIMKRFMMRQQHLQTVCSRPEYRRPDHGLRTSDSNFHYVALHRLQWCSIAKVGTMFMKSKFYPQKPLRSQDLDEKTQAYLFNHPKSFYFVRDPYSRLVSGFLDKLMTAPDRWGDIGRKVIISQRKDASPYEVDCGSDVTFLEFFKYVIWAETTNKTRNIHFLPMHDLCDVCNRNYDYIGHLETIKEDLPYIVDSVGVVMDLSENTTDDVVGLFKKVFLRNRQVVKTCLGIYPMMKRMWWSLQARGLIADTMPLPASKSEVEMASWEQLASWAAQAHINTRELGSRSAQKRAFRIDLFREIPLHLRLWFVELYSKDFQLFQFEPLPPDYFPEFNNVINDH